MALMYLNELAMKKIYKTVSSLIAKVKNALGINPSKLSKYEKELKKIIEKENKKIKKKQKR
jgi:hypothetical protein